MLGRLRTSWRDAGRRAVVVLMALPMLVGFLPRVGCAERAKPQAAEERAAAACCLKHAKACQGDEGASQERETKGPRPCDQHCPGCPVAGMMVPPVEAGQVVRGIERAGVGVPVDDGAWSQGSLRGIFHPPRVG